MAFATATVEALFEQADFRLEFVEALLELGFALVPAGFQVGLAEGELLLKAGFAEESAVVEGLGRAGLLARIAEGLLAGG